MTEIEQLQQAVLELSARLNKMEARLGTLARDNERLMREYSRRNCDE